MLLRLLSEVHRDGGHYTTLAGLETSVDEACFVVRELHRKVAALHARIGQLSKASNG